MGTYNLEIVFVAEHLKTQYYAQIQSEHFKETDIGLWVFRPNEPNVFYPWTAIAKFVREALPR